MCNNGSSWVKYDTEMLKQIAAENDIDFDDLMYDLNIGLAEVVELCEPAILED